MQIEIIERVVRYTHNNGHILEMVGDELKGEWFAYDDQGHCVTQGFYELDDQGEGTFFSNKVGMFMNNYQPVSPDQLDNFVESILVAHQ
jgi:hypothetical protein